MTTIKLKKNSDGSGFDTNKPEYEVTLGGFLVIEFPPLKSTLTFEHGLIDPTWFRFEPNKQTFKIHPLATVGKSYQAEFSDLADGLVDDLYPRVKVIVKP